MALNHNTLKAWAIGLNAVNAAEQVSTGMDLLVTAASSNQVQVLKHAIEFQGVPVDILLQWAPPGRYPRRRTLLMIAASCGCIEAVHYLLCNGADPNGPSPDDGFSSLHCAAESGNARTAEIIAVLLHYGGLRDSVDMSGRRPVDLLAELIDARQGAMFPGQMEVGADVPGLVTGPSELDKDEFKTDEFRMFGFKVTKCSKCRAHDWTECPFAHPGEKARRRDPTKFTYSGTACPDFRKGSCKRGDSCQYAHGVFECWLHPSLYRTQLCKDAPMCTRRVCFFAHSLQELRQPTETPTSAAPSSPSSPACEASDLSPSPSFNRSDSVSSPSTLEADDRSSSASGSLSFSSSPHTSADPLAPVDQAALTAQALAAMLQQMTNFGLTDASFNAYLSPQMAGMGQMSQDSLSPAAAPLDLLSQLQSLNADPSAKQAAAFAASNDSRLGYRTGSYEAFDQWINILTEENEQQAQGWPSSSTGMATGGSSKPSLKERACNQHPFLHGSEYQVAAM